MGVAAGWRPQVVSLSCKQSSRKVVVNFLPTGAGSLYSSDESRELEVYVTAFPAPSGKRRVSTAQAAAYPRWRRDGKEIFYLSPDNKLMAVEVSLKGTELEIGTARALFEVNTFAGAGCPYDVTPDGQRFLFMTSLEQKEVRLRLLWCRTGRWG